MSKGRRGERGKGEGRRRGGERRGREGKGGEYGVPWRKGWYMRKRVGCKLWEVGKL